MNKILNFFIILSFAVCLSYCSSHKKENNIPEEDQHFKNSQNPVLNAINDALEEDPENADLFFKRAKIFFEEKKMRQAINDVNNAIHLDNTNASYYLLLAGIYKALNKNPQALKFAKQAEAMNSQDPELFILLAQLYFELEDKKNAEYYLNQSQLLAPLHAEIFVLKGNSFASKGDTLSAMLNYYTALQKDGSNLDALKELAKIYNAKHKYDSSMILIIKGKSLDHKEPVFDYLHGKVLEHLNLIEAAKFAHHTALASDSSFYKSLISLGNISYKSNKLLDAYNWYTNALSFNSDISSVNLRVAEILETLNRGAEAIPYYERAALIDTANLKINAILKKLYTLHGVPAKQARAISASPVNMDAINKPKSRISDTTSYGKVKSLKQQPKSLPPASAPLPAPKPEAERPANQNTEPIKEEVKTLPPPVPAITEEAGKPSGDASAPEKSIFKKRKRNKDTLQ